MRSALLPLLAVAALLFASPVLAGEWGTSYGTMTLPDEPAAGPVRAPYSQDEGRVIGDLLQPKCMDCGWLLEGYWVERGSAQECSSSVDGSRHWGRVAFEFSPAYDAFIGTWDYCGAGETRAWKGQVGRLDFRLLSPH